MEKLNELMPVFVDEIPKIKEPGILYICKQFSSTSHLCACGCGGECYLPLDLYIDGKDLGWHMTENDGKVTLKPSIGNWSGETPYHAHYFITDNKIKWC